MDRCEPAREAIERQATGYAVIIATGVAFFVLWFGIAGARRLAGGRLRPVSRAGLTLRRSR